MEELCDLALDKLGNISNEVHIDEYSQFDVLTGVRISVAFAPNKEDTNQERWSDRLAKSVGHH